MTKETTSATAQENNNVNEQITEMPTPNYREKDYIDLQLDHASRYLIEDYDYKTTLRLFASIEKRWPDAFEENERIGYFYCVRGDAKMYEDNIKGAMQDFTNSIRLYEEYGDDGETFNIADAYHYRSRCKYLKGDKEGCLLDLEKMFRFDSGLIFGDMLFSSIRRDKAPYRAIAKQAIEGLTDKPEKYRYYKSMFEHYVEGKLVSKGELKEMEQAMYNTERPLLDEEALQKLRQAGYDIDANSTGNLEDFNTDAPREEE